MLEVPQCGSRLTPVAPTNLLSSLDEMLARLAQVYDPMAKPKTKTRSIKQRAADRARMATHGFPFVWRDGQRLMLYGGDRTACGERFVRPGKLRRHAEVDPAQVDCAACVKLLAMSASEFGIHTAAEAKKLSDVRAKQQDKAAKAKAEQQMSKWDRVHQYEDDALVALDAYLSGTHYSLMDEVLSAAVLKHRLMFPVTRGEKLWLFSGSEVHDQSGTRRVIECRFCRKRVGLGELGKDYSHSWFDTHSWREFATESNYEREYGDSPSRVCVGRHCTLCALAYLSGTECVEPVP